MFDGLMPALLFGIGVFGMLAMLILAFSAPSAGKAQDRRLEAVRGRHVAAKDVEAQMRRITAYRDTALDSWYASFIPNPALLARRIEQTGKDWTLKQYITATLGLAVLVGAAV
ncbi:MAG: pilus assembly protein TadB, partial [Hyphomicrobiales bacterium]